MSNKKQIKEHIFIDQDCLIGKGSTGNVYSGFSVNSQHKKYAVKAIDLRQVDNQVTQYLLSCEIAALSQLAKLNVRAIVKLQDIAFQQHFCYLVMELLEGGPLSQYIKLNPNGMAQHEYLHLFRQMFEGYKAIRNLGIVHRDIKPDNLIFRQTYNQQINHKNQAKSLCFIDFGYCTMERVPNRPKAYYNVGSPKYMSPQAFRQNIYSQKSDIWALGIILYEMIHGKTIDTGMQMSEYIDFMRNNPIPLANNVSPLVRNLLLGLLTFDYRKRISCQAIQQMLNGQQFQLQSINNNHREQNIPQLNIRNHQANNSHNQFYQSAVVQTNRSLPQQNTIQIENSNFGRRVQRNISNQNKYKEFHNSPRKVVHVQNLFNVPLQNVQLISKNAHVPSFIRGQRKQLMPNQGMIQRNQRLQRIVQQQNENQATRNNRTILNNTNDRFDMRRNFLRSITQNQHPLIQNNNMRILNPPQFIVNPQSPMKNQSRQNQVFRSQIISHNNNLQMSNKKNNPFYASQINQTPNNSIRIVTSDKIIKNNELYPIFQQGPQKQMFKSYSTNSVQINIQKQQNPFQHGMLTDHQNRIPLINAPVNQMRPIDRLINQKQVSNMRGFLRNTMPASKSFIQNPNPNTQFFERGSFIRQQISISPKTLQKSFIQNSQNTVYKSHASYFRNNQTQSQKQRHQIISFNVSPFNAQHHQHMQQNRQNKTNSLKNLPQQMPILHTNFIQKPEVQYQLNKNNQNNIQMGHHFAIHNQQKFQQAHNKFVQFNHQKNHVIENSHISTQNTSNNNSITAQGVRRSYMIHQQTPKQSRIPAFIINNQQQRHINQNEIQINQNQHILHQKQTINHNITYQNNNFVPFNNQQNFQGKMGSIHMQNFNNQNRQVINNVPHQHIVYNQNENVNQTKVFNVVKDPFQRKLNPNFQVSPFNQNNLNGNVRIMPQNNRLILDQHPNLTKEIIYTNALVNQQPLRVFHR